MAKTISLLALLLLLTACQEAMQSPPTAQKVLGNSAPRASASNAVVLNWPANSTQLDGEAVDPDGDELFYRWALVSGKSDARIETPAVASTVVSNLSVGDYIFSLTVTDVHGVSSVSETSVSVVKVSNTAPVANAGIDRLVAYPGTSITLIGRGSDLDGDPLTYRWSQVSGTPASLSAPLASTCAFSQLSPGLYTFRLTVTDIGGLAHADDVVVTVTPASNAAPVANAGADLTLAYPTTSVKLAGSASDANGDTLTYSWSKFSGGSAMFATPAALETMVSDLAPGTYLFRLEARDPFGAAHADEVKVTVQGPANAAPIANAGADQTITLPTNSVTLNGSGSDANNDPLSFTWNKVSALAATLAPTGAKLVVTDLAEGTHTFRLTVKDIYGASASDDVVVTVKAADTTVAGLAPPTPVPGKLQIWQRNKTAETWYPEYDAVVFLPKTYVSTKKYTLIISLYGIGGRVLDGNHTALPNWHEGFINQVWDGSTLQGTFPAIVIAPEGRGYNDNNNVWWNAQKLKALLDATMKYYSVDPDRVVVTGLSSGGAGTLQFVGTYPSLFAGAMPLAMGPQGIDPCKYTFPLWVQGNADDGIFNLWAWNGGTQNFEASIEACPAYNNTFTLTWNNSGGHGGWDQFWSRSDVQAWLTTRIRGQNPPY